MYSRSVIPRECVPPVMTEYAEKRNLKLSKLPQLVTSFSGDRVLLTAEYLRFLMKVGYEVDSIDTVYQYDTGLPFAPFIASEIAKRKAASERGDDLAADVSILGDNIQCKRNKLKFIPAAQTKQQ